MERRYVIDGSVGSVGVFLVFGGGGTRLPDSHEFRVEGRKIRYVHSVTKYWEVNCGKRPASAVPFPLVEFTSWTGTETEIYPWGIATDMACRVWGPPPAILKGDLGF